MVNRKVEVMKLFHEVSKVLMHNMRKEFENTGITMPQSVLIGILFKNGAMKVSELSNRLSLTNSTVSGIVDRLEKLQIVERKRSKEDKRVVHVNLTPQYLEKHQDFHEIIKQIFYQQLDKGTNEEIEKIIDGLNVLKRIVGERIE